MGLDPGHPFLVKDALSCTLACLLALRKWNMGTQLVQTGLDFIATTAAAAGRNDQFSPNGFNIIFPAMLNYAKELDLTLPITPTLLDSMLRFGDSELSERKGKQEYVAEGLGNSCDWKKIISTHQRSNGSLFNSPATTAAALIHSPDHKCSEYLISLLKTCNGCGDLEIDFQTPKRVEFLKTNATYRCWQEKEEEIFCDVTCQAMAFRLLRMRGYDVSSDELAEFVYQEHFFNTIGMQYGSVTTVLELYRASQIRVREEERTLEKIHDWTKVFLKQQLLNRNILDKRLRKQVDYDLKNFHGMLDRFENRRSIELYDAQGFQIAKTAYRCPTIHNDEFILFAVQDYRISQHQYEKELQIMQRWYAESRLDRLNEGRSILQTSYILTAALIVDPELSAARISCAQGFVLGTCLDDFIDEYGSGEEALSMIELVRQWNRQAATSYCSEKVEILFTALYNTVNEVTDKAYEEHGQSFKEELISMWVAVIRGYVSEKNCWSENKVATLDEYLSSALVGRLLNDLKTYKKEEEENILNSVSVLTAEGAMTEEEAILKVEQLVEYYTRKVREMVYRREGSKVPRECKELAWKICKLAHCVYPQDGGDEFSSPREIAEDMNALIWETIQLPPLSKSCM